MARQETSGSRRGFASMSKEKQRSIASKGGRAAHEKGTAHKFTSEEARIAGRKGGEAGGAPSRVRQPANSPVNPIRPDQSTSSRGANPSGEEGDSS